MSNDPLLALIFSLVLSYVFVVAAIHKWKAMTEFRETILNYQVVPGFLVAPLAFAFPLVEFVSGVALLIPQTSSVAAVCVAMLLLTYILAMAINLLKGRRSIDCGCGGTDQKQNISEWLLIRNGVLVFFAWCVMTSVQGREFSWFDWLVAFLATVVICLIYNILNQLLVNRDLLKVLRNHG